MDGLVAQTGAALQLVYSGADRVLGAVEGAVPGEAVRDFVQTVNWREPFILGLLLAQCALWTLAAVTRRSDVLQFLLVALLCGGTLFAKRLNALGRANWEHFATQDYFDKNGTFLLIFVLAPFVLLANAIVVRAFAHRKRCACRRADILIAARRSTCCSAC